VTFPALQRASLRLRSHRPFPLPRAPWVMGQSWDRLLFAHWRVPPRELELLVPSGLAIDTYEGEAWLGVTPFRVVGLHPRLLPPLPRVSTFLETNVRTYVIRDGTPGIFFFRLLATSRIAVEGARLGYSLPYRCAEGSMRCDDDITDYLIRLKGPGAEQAQMHVRYAAASRFSPAPRRSLEHWLVERYCLYTQTPGGQLLRTHIHHAPWSITPAKVSMNLQGLAPAALGALHPQPLVHHADRQHVLVWAPNPA